MSFPKPGKSKSSKTGETESISTHLAYFSLQKDATTPFKIQVFSHPAYMKSGNGSKFCNTCGFPHGEANAPTTRRRFDRCKFCSLDCYQQFGKNGTATQHTLERQSMLAVGSQIMRQCLNENEMSNEQKATLAAQAQQFYARDVQQSYAWAMTTSSVLGTSTFSPFPGGGFAGVAMSPFAGSSPGMSPPFPNSPTGDTRRFTKSSKQEKKKKAKKRKVGEEG